MVDLKELELTEVIKEGDYFSTKNKKKAVLVLSWAWGKNTRDLRLEYNKNYYKFYRPIV
jgi:hypothetical protein